MQYKVKGITFTMDDLKNIPLIDIKTGTISRSHLIHFLPGMKKAMILLRAGDFVDQEFVTKYIEKGMVNLYALEVVSKEDLQVYRSFWRELKNCKTGSEQLLVRDEILKKLAENFYENNERCFLSFLISCFEEFYTYPGFVMEKFQSLSMTLYSRAILTSSISVITSLCSGYTNYAFLKDFFNTCFIMDYGLVEYENYNYTIGLACEHERLRPGSGIEILKRMKRSESEQQTFLNHPNISFEFAQTQAEGFDNPELVNVIRMHHEKFDGTGFPNAYSYSALSDTETLLMFCDYMVPFSEHEFSAGDGHQILFKAFENLKEIKELNKLPIDKIMNYWESSMQWAVAQIQTKVDELIAVEEELESLGEAS